MRNYYFTKCEIQELKRLGLDDDQIGDLWKPARRLYLALPGNWPTTFSNLTKVIQATPLFPDDFNPKEYETTTDQ